jgi:hypothetical protein
MNDLSPPALEAECRITTHAFVEARLSSMGALRNRAAPEGAPQLPPRFLRHADEHTVVGMRAVLTAFAKVATTASLPPMACHAVIAAPCQAGRIATAQALAGLETSGPSAIKPHIVPQCSMHSVAGAVSVAIGAHGPHLGVGGGPDALSEGLLVVASLLAGGGDPQCRAAWLIATEWDVEPALDTSGIPTDDPLCRAIAMFLEPSGMADDVDRTGSLTLAFRQSRRRPTGGKPAATSCTIAAMRAALGDADDRPAADTTTLICLGGFEVEVTRHERHQVLREAA